MTAVYFFLARAQVSDSYHSDGGVVVVADTPEQAVGIANKEPGCSISLPADVVVECDKHEPMLFIFPNAGCC